MQVVKNEVAGNIIHKQNVSLMGSAFEISVMANDVDWAEERIDSAIAEIKRIDKLLTTLGDDSQTNLINHNAGIAPVKIKGELFKLIDRLLKIAELTQGAFDITYGTSFSYHKVELDATNSTVFLKEKNMRLYFGNIAMGYAADRVKYILQMEGVGSGVIKVDETLITWGTQPDGNSWTIAAADPDQYAQPYSSFNISNMAIATSKKDGLTDYANDGASSVCIMSTSAELASALTMPVRMLGVKVGTDLIDRLQQLACVFVDEYNQMFASKFMNTLTD